eukprot:scpid54169/ scgid23149/ 
MFCFSKHLAGLATHQLLLRIRSFLQGRVSRSAQSLASRYPTLRSNGYALKLSKARATPLPDDDGQGTELETQLTYTQSPRASKQQKNRSAQSNDDYDSAVAGSAVSMVRAVLPVGVYNA